MFRDPKQFLLMHVEKVVLVVMLILLLLVIYVYKPWSIEIPETNEIRRQLEDGQMLVDRPVWKLPEVPDYVAKTSGIIRVPWTGDTTPPTVLPYSKPVFVDLMRKGTIWREQAPDAPPILPPAAVYAKADKGQVVVVFQIDDQSQRRKLEGTAVQEYQEGLEYDHIEIWRIDKTTGERIQITPADWRPKELPARYGAPATVYGTPTFAPRSMFGEPVYLFAQNRPPDPRKMEEDLRRQMEEDMRRRMEEEKQRQDELRRRLEEDRRRRMGETPTETPTRRTPTRRTPTVTTPQPPMRRPTRITRTPVLVVAPTGWYYFIDQKVDPDAQYEYAIIISCKNPVFGSPRYTGAAEKVVPVVRSAPATVLADKKIASFKRWYFQGGTVSEQLEMGTFKVRVFVGGRREITMDEINVIVAELSGTAGTKKSATPPEPEGIWVEHNFTVRPGEVIGKMVNKPVGDDKRDIEFGTGCTLVSIMNDVKVVEEPYTVTRPGPDGKFQTVQLLRRVVFPQKLRIAYVDRKGKLMTRWQEVAPSLSATELPEKAEK
ncbi:MAG TPA: hypothetical protein VMZ92_02935 [Planctomycetota bacterium]|nr:hypothetical protein [Planctomycetota bacterium]